MTYMPLYTAYVDAGPPLGVRCLLDELAGNALLARLGTLRVERNYSGSPTRPKHSRPPATRPPCWTPVAHPAVWSRRSSRARGCVAAGQMHTSGAVALAPVCLLGLASLCFARPACCLLASPCRCCLCLAPPGTWHTLKHVALWPWPGFASRHGTGHYCSYAHLALEASCRQQQQQAAEAADEDCSWPRQ